jgi:phosphoglycerate dehydrogenase-like enzyme
MNDPMAPIRAHLLYDIEDGPWDHFRSKLDPRIAPTRGSPAPSDIEILVHGFPTSKDLAASPALRALVVPFAGIPLRTRGLLREHPSIAVHNLHYNSAPTAETAIALLLAAAKTLLPLDRNFRGHVWTPPPQIGPAVLLEGKTALVLGYGEVGRRVARGCLGMGMRVAALRRRGPGRDGDIELHGPDALRTLLPAADVVFVCLPETAETAGLLGEAELGLLPKSAVLVNVARGAIVDEQALYRALKERRLHSAGLDVWYRYPPVAERKSGRPYPPSNLPFHELDNVVMTPHRAGWSDETEMQRSAFLAEMLNHAARGEPLPNRVDLALGY